MGSASLGLTTVAALVAAGVGDVVVAPGSRNAPLSIALARAEGVRLLVRIDERSAGFLALGIAKASGRPVAVVTTSGTAVGNLLPAVMEASHSGVPLVVLSADRPATAHGTGANQTTDQVGIFGGFVRAQAVLASESDAPEAWVAALQRLVVAASGTRTRDPGPVHADLQFAEPLLGGLDAATGSVPRMVVSASRTAEPVRLPGVPRTVVLAGDASPGAGSAARELAESAGLPLLAEPSSNARAGDHAISLYRLLLGKPDLGGRIERVLMFGHPTLSRPVSRLLARRDIELVAVTGAARWPDAGHAVRRVTDAVEVEAGDPHWLNQWRTGDEVLRLKLGLLREGFAEPSPLDIADLVVARVGSEQNLVFGSSNPIRDADLAPVSANPPLTWANRGLAGIDGTISTAAGIALATGRPTTLYAGDLTALHDAGGLWLGRLEERPALRVVVLDDSGGAIFHSLEQGAPDYADVFERVFATPHDADICALTAAYGWQAARVDDLTELSGRLRMPPRAPELLVVPASRERRREVAEALAAL